MLIQNTIKAHQDRLAGVLDAPRPWEDDALLKTRPDDYPQRSVIPHVFADRVKALPTHDRRRYELKMPIWYTRHNLKTHGIPFCRMKYGVRYGPYSPLFLIIQNRLARSFEVRSTMYASPGLSRPTHTNSDLPKGFALGRAVSHAYGWIEREDGQDRGEFHDDRDCHAGGVGPACPELPLLPLTVTHVLEHLFCPRFTYFEHVLAVPERQERRLLVQKGREAHEERRRITRIICEKNSEWSSESSTYRFSPSG